MFEAPSPTALAFHYTPRFLLVYSLPSPAERKLVEGSERAPQSEPQVSLSVGVGVHAQPLTLLRIIKNRTTIGPPSGPRTSHSADRRRTTTGPLHFGTDH